VKSQKYGMLNRVYRVLTKCAVSVSEAAEEVGQRPVAGSGAQFGPPCDWTDWPDWPGWSQGLVSPDCGYHVGCRDRGMGDLGL
jgi:hypothetical protein